MPIRVFQLDVQACLSFARPIQDPNEFDVIVECRNLKITLPAEKTL